MVDPEMKELVEEAPSTRGGKTPARDLTPAVSVIFDLATALSEATSYDGVVAAIVSRCATAFGACGAVIATLTANGQDIVLQRSRAMPDDIERVWHTFPVSAPVPIAQVARTGEPEFIESRGQWVALYPHIGALLEETGHHAVAALPLVAGGRRIGVLGLSFDAMRTFTEDERVLLTAAACLCAQALDRAKLYEEERAARAAAELSLARAEEANRAKANFLAIMSHELRTPLNAIGGYAQLIELGVRGAVTEGQRLDLARIQRSKDHLLGLVSDVLTFVQLDTGHVSYSMSDVDVAATCEHVAEIVAPQLAAQRLQFVYARNDIGISARADVDKLRQILINLLTNAGKYTDAGGRVELSFETSGDRVLIHVNDSGRGIPFELLGKIFEPFVQVGRRLDKPVDGVGLGLAISRDFARGMGGDIDVESVLGTGSRFTVTLARCSLPG